jgi:hypothetical protein
VASNSAVLSLGTKNLHERRVQRLAERGIWGAGCGAGAGRQGPPACSLVDVCERPCSCGRLGGRGGHAVPYGRRHGLQGCQGGGGFFGATESKYPYAAQGRYRWGRTGIVRRPCAARCCRPAARADVVLVAIIVR